jgi:hypothetical protein
VNFISEIFSWAEGSRKAQATALGIFFTLFYKVPEKLGVNYEVSDTQLYLVNGLLAIFVIARMGHDMSLSKVDMEEE